MLHKFAKAIAANLRVMAAHSATVALIDNHATATLYPAENRALCVEAINKAEQNIVSILMQPGANLRLVDGADVMERCLVVLQTDEDHADENKELISDLKALLGKV